MTKDNEKTYLCFDLGTTRIKSALLDSQGNIIYLDSEKALSHRDGDAVIQKPEEYYQSVIRQIQAMGRKHGEFLKNADSLICSGQMAGILSIDKNWEVVMPWTYSVDTRANRYLSGIEDDMAPDIRASSGGVPFMAAKIKWIKEELPDQYAKSVKFINLNTYVAGRLAGLTGSQSFIDYSVLAMNGLADIEKGTWNRRIIGKLGLDEEKLPIIKPPYSQVGAIPKERFATKDDIKVLAGIGDQIAGFIGAGILEKGDLIDVAGTYTVLGYAGDSFVPDVDDRIISSIYSGMGDLYYHLAVVAVGGYLYNWFLNGFNYDDSRLDRVKDTGGLFFIPYVGGRTAPLQPYYQGTFYGLKWEHDLDSAYTSMLECIGYDYDLILDKIKELNGLKKDDLHKVKVIGGGAGNHIWNTLKANIMGLDYEAMEETSYEILGDFLIARYGDDLKTGYKRLMDRDIVTINEKVSPDREKADYYRKNKQKYRKIVEKIGSIYREFER